MRCVRERLWADMGAADADVNLINALHLCACTARPWHLLIAFPSRVLPDNADAAASPPVIAASSVSPLCTSPRAEPLGLQ